MLFTALILSIFLEYVNPDSFVPVIGAMKIGTIVPLLTLVIALAQTRPVSNARLFQHKNTKWLLAFLVLQILSILHADVTVYSFEVFKLGLANFFWFIMVAKIAAGYEQVKRVFAALIWCHIILLILNPNVVLEPESRSYITGAPFLGDGNDFALSLCLTWPMCLVLIRDAKSRSARIFHGGAMVILILAIIGTQSRGATLALGASAGFLWWISRRKMLGILVLVSLAGIVVSFAPPQYFERMSTLANYQQEGSAMGRIVAWKSAMRMAAEYPVTGVGTGHFAVALGTEFRPPEFDGLNLPWATAHSAYFLVLGELGMPGLVVLLVILIGNFRRLNKLRVAARDGPDSIGESYGHLFAVLGTSLVGFCVAAAFLSVTYYPHIAILCGLITAAMFAHEDSLKED